MPQYAINTATGLRPLGKFDDIEQVKKLRLFKDNPEWISRVEILTIAKAPRKSNRWRVIFDTDNVVDLRGIYTKLAVIELLEESIGHYKLRIVPKREYHESDGII